MTKCAELANLIGNINAGGGGVNRNLIINGAMNVAQRGTSFADVSGGTYTLDRFIRFKNHDGAVTITQDSSGPDGFSNSLKVDVTTADTNLTGTQNEIFGHKIEAQNLQSLAFGTSSAKNFTVSFYVKSNKTGTYALNVVQSDNSSKSATLNYTIDSANTWERKSVTFTGDASGVINDDNGIGFEMSWFLAAGPTYTSGSASASFATFSNANYAAGQTVNLLDSTDNEWFITGVQLEVGQNPTEFEHQKFSQTLNQCKRYYLVFADGSADADENIGNHYGWSTSQSEGVIRWEEMRAVPSVLRPTGTNYYKLHSFNDDKTFDNWNTYKTTNRSMLIYKQGLTITQGRGYRFTLNNASAYIHLDAEL